MMTNEDPLKLNNHNYQMNIYYSDNLLNGECGFLIKIIQLLWTQIKHGMQD